MASLSPVSSRSVDGRLADRQAELGLQEVEVAALVRLADVPVEHPAVAAAEARRRRRPGGAAAGQLLLRDAHADPRSEEHTSELQSRQYLVCRLLLEKKNITI